MEAKVNGKKEVLSVTIKPEAVDPEDVEMLQDLVISAVNEALRQAEDAMSTSMNALTGAALPVETLAEAGMQRGGSSGWWTCGRGPGQG